MEHYIDQYMRRPPDGREQEMARGIMTYMMRQGLDDDAGMRVLALMVAWYIEHRELLLDFRARQTLYDMVDRVLRIDKEQLRVGAEARSAALQAHEAALEKLAGDRKAGASAAREAPTIADAALGKVSETL